MFAFQFNPWEVPSGAAEQILRGGKSLLLPPAPVLACLPLL